MSIFGWSYPPGVTGNKPEIAGGLYEDDCTECGEQRELCPDCGACEDCPCCGDEEEYDNMAEIDDAAERGTSFDA